LFTILIATKVRLYPTFEEADFLNQQFGAVRFVYNKALWIVRHLYRVRGRQISILKVIKALLPIAKKSRKYSWLAAYDSISLQEAVRNLAKAFKNFFDPKLAARYPSRKRKHGKQSSYHCMSVDVGDRAIKIPKLGWVKARLHREIKGTIKSITLSRSRAGKHYASILWETEEKAVAKPLAFEDLDPGKMVGIDLGLTHFATLSSGEKIENPRFLVDSTKRIKRAQRSVSRKKKGSRNRAKARMKLARAHEKAANRRMDFEHKLSRRLIDENQVVAAETLAVKELLKEHRLARAISDAGWSRFCAMLKYKAEKAGKLFVAVDQFYPSSKTCSCCGHKEKELPLSRRQWQCPECGADHDRDVNAARNILAEAVRLLRRDGLAHTLPLAG
jgi:putative transposase